MFSSSIAEENGRAAHNNDVTTASLQQNLPTSDTYYVARVSKIIRYQSFWRKEIATEYNISWNILNPAVQVDCGARSNFCTIVRFLRSLAAS